MIRQPSPLIRALAVLALLGLGAPGVRSQALQHFALDPRVVSETQSDPVTLTAAVSGNPSAVEIDLSGGGTIPLVLVAPGSWQVVLSPSQVLDGYVPGRTTNFVGWLRVQPVGQSVNLFVNVRTTAMPAVVLRQLAADAQVGPHVFNLMSDELLLGQHAPQDMLLRFYQFVEDDYDFVAVIEQVHSVNNRSYRNLRNNVSGIGLSIFDNALSYGSPARLQGTIAYPNDSFFDLAETSNLHEIGHNWINFLSLPILAQSAPHWPLSDLARGVMGYGCLGCQGLQFPYTLVQQPSGDFDLVWTGPSREFNDLELYLMGLVSANEVGTHFVFDDQNQAVPGSGTLLAPVTEFGIQDVIVADGPRDPTAATAQTKFRVATIVLSEGRLLTAEEMAWFDHMALRGESDVELPFSLGLEVGTTKPFFLATGEIGKLETRLTLRTWIDMGFDLAGTFAAPRLQGFGALQGGDPVSLVMTHALPNSFSALFIGASTLMANFMGGVLVPTVDELHLWFPTAADGSQVLASTWPPGIPSDVTVYFQQWIIDPGGPFGFSASNGLAATTP